MKKRKVQIIVCLVFAIFLTLVEVIHEKSEKHYTAYSTLVDYVQQDEVESIEVLKGRNIAEIKLRDGKHKEVRIPSDDEVAKLVSDSDKDINFRIKEEDSLFSDIYSTVQKASRIILVIFIILIYCALVGAVIKAFQGEDTTDADDDPLFGNSKFGKEAKSTIKFDDVAGIDEERQQLEELVGFLKDAEKYTKMGATIPKGILLTGAPGVGKTLLAKAIAGEADVPVFQVTGSSFEQALVGVGSSRVRTLFKKARAKAPSIIFIDEIDTIGVKRYASATNYHEDTLNQLLAEMDGFNSSTGVIVIAATNHPEMLDSAVTRAGRFDRKINIPMPDVYARTKILNVHSRNKKLDENVNLEYIAKKTVGFSGAELRNLLNEAAILAVRRESEVIQQDDLDEAFARVVVGLEKKNRRITEKEKYHTAIHEAGHAIASAVVRPDVENLGISIVPRGTAGGYNLFNPTEEKNYLNKEDSIAELIVEYAGKAAEKVILEVESSGPSSDLQEASKMAYEVVLKYAMGSGSLLTLTGNEKLDSILIQNNLKNIEKLCDDAYNQSLDIIKANVDILKELAQILMEKEVLSAEEVNAFLKDKKLNRKEEELISEDGLTENVD